jgi:hypothetical protein
MMKIWSDMEAGKGIIIVSYKFGVSQKSDRANLESVGY